MSSSINQLTSKEAEKLFERLSDQDPQAKIDALAVDGISVHLGYEFEDISDLNHAWYFLGDAFFKKDQMAQASQCFLNAINCWPRDIDAYIGYSNSEESEKKVISVLSYGRQACPNDTGIILNLANCLMSQGDATGARQLLEGIPPESDEHCVATEILSELDARL